MSVSFPGKFRFHAVKTLYKQTIQLHVGLEDGDYFGVAKPLIIEKHAPEAVSTESCMDLRPDDAQRLMDELWHVGIRPSQQANADDALLILKDHLEDMRTIAFKYLNMGDHDDPPG